MINPYSIATAWFVLGFITGVCAIVVVVAAMDGRSRRSRNAEIVNLAEWKEKGRA